jgi:hypothetical protein
MDVKKLQEAAKDFIKKRKKHNDKYVYQAFTPPPALFEDFLVFLFAANRIRANEGLRLLKINQILEFMVEYYISSHKKMVGLKDYQFSFEKEVL